MASGAQADGATWTAGPAEATVTIEFFCADTVFCAVFPQPYSSTRTIPLTGAGTALLVPGSLGIFLDDLVSPPHVDAWMLVGESTAYDQFGSGFFPVLNDAILFFTTGGPIVDPGITLTPGPAIPFTEDFEVGFRFDFDGLSMPFFNQIAGPITTSCTGEFEAGPADDFLVRELTGTFVGDHVTPFGTGTITARATVDFDVTLNDELSDFVPVVPLLSPTGLALLVGTLGLAGYRRVRA
jgi:hypothetical protein